MSAFLDTISLFFAKCIQWLGSLMTFIDSQPALVVLVLAMPIVGFAVGLLNRLIRS